MSQLWERPGHLFFNDKLPQSWIAILGWACLLQSNRIQSPCYPLIHLRGLYGAQKGLWTSTKWIDSDQGRDIGSNVPVHPFCNLGWFRNTVWCLTSAGFLFLFVCSSVPLRDRSGCVMKTVIWGSTHLLILMQMKMAVLSEEFHCVSL